MPSVPEEVGALAVTAGAQPGRGAVDAVGRVVRGVDRQKVFDFVLFGEAAALVGSSWVAELTVTGARDDHGQRASDADSLYQVGVGVQRVRLAAQWAGAAMGAPLGATRVGATDARGADHSGEVVLVANRRLQAWEAVRGLRDVAAGVNASGVPYVDHTDSCVRFAKPSGRSAGRVP